eukprot:2329745-Amphidinium_carterae.1
MRQTRSGSPLESNCFIGDCGRPRCAGAPIGQGSRAGASKDRRETLRHTHTHCCCLTAAVASVERPTRWNQ